MAIRLTSQTATTTLWPRSTPRPTGVLQVMSVGCAALADEEPQALGLTYWFDAAQGGEPYTATVRFTGHRTSVRGKPTTADSFTASERIERVVPGSGRVAVTARIFDVSPGEWRVTATLIMAPRPRAPAGRSTPARPPPRSNASGTTAYAPVIRVRAPGARLGVWPALVGIGVVGALVVQALLAAQLGVSVTPTLLVSLTASLVGLLGARIYYLAQRGPKDLLTPRALLTSGMCIQGFMLAAIATAAIGALVLGMSVGRFVDATAPALLFGMAIGRLGCFFGGCCAGQPTASRWGLWSSDRRVGVRRIPTQLLEAGLSLTVGLIALIAVLTTSAPRPGAVFVGAIAAYTLGRQLLLRWRDLPRATSHGRAITFVVMALVLVGDIAISAR